jgi:hypothetical protein
VHAGGVEFGEARVGWASPKGFGGAWVGRADLPATRDRDMEAEDLPFSTRPALSRAVLPLHATGVGVGAAWPECADVDLGASWPTTTADAPYTWARLRAHPLGALPEEWDAPVEGPRVQLGGGVARLDSPSLGETLLVEADLAGRLGGFALEGGWIRLATDHVSDEAWAELGGATPAVHGADLHLALRGERVTSLVEDEDLRWIGTARLSLRASDRRFALYAEYTLTREEGTPAGDVVTLDRGIERANDTLAVGARLRIR